MAEPDQKRCEEIGEWDTKLGQLLNELNCYLKTAISNGSLGNDDPLSHTFTKSIKQVETRVRKLRENEPEEPTDTSMLSTLWSHVRRMIGYSASVSLDQDLELREESFRDAQDVFEQMRDTTESSPRYTDINKSLPKDGESLIKLDDGSATKLLQVISKLAPSVENSAKFMEYSFANTGMIERDVIQSAFATMDQEVNYILSMRQVKRDVEIRGIVENTLQMARIFVIMLNKEGGRAYVDFANDRFKAVYTLIQNISTILQDLKVLEEPPGLLFSRIGPFTSRPSPDTGTLSWTNQGRDVRFSDDILFPSRHN